VTTNLLTHFILQREMARQNHDAGKPQPFCDDPIINTYRFCNVRREDDKVTRWLKKHWRDPYWDYRTFVPAMILARMVNWPPTLKYVGFPKEWDDGHIVASIQECATRGKAWTGAYVITTCGVSMDKAEYVVRTASQALAMPPYHTSRVNSLEGLWTSLKGIQGLGAGFLAAQVVADLKYTPLFKYAPDWWTFAAPGPGSRRGVNRYFALPLHTKLSNQEWLRHLRLIVNDQKEHIKLHAQDWQNVMCEYDKYVRVKKGEGRPRSRYTPDQSYDI